MARPVSGVEWLSDDMVRFKYAVGVEEKTLNTCKMAIPAAWHTVYTPCCRNGHYCG